MFFLDTGHIVIWEIQTQGNTVAREDHWGEKLVITGSSNSSLVGINVKRCVWHYAYSENQSVIPETMAREDTGSKITVCVQEVQHDQ